MKKRILLTGSNGLTGQKLVNLLAGRQSVRLIATSRGVNRQPFEEGYVYEPADLSDFSQWKALFHKYRPTDVIHTAALTQVDYCETHPEECEKVNVHAVANLTRLCKAYGARLTYLSTDFVFDGQKGPYLESDLPRPVNVYGRSKFHAEQLIQSEGIPYTILRTILLYGTGTSLARSNLVLWVKRSLEAGKPIQVVNDQFRAPTLAEDFALATAEAVMREANGMYHIAGPELMSVSEIAYRVAEFWKLDAALITAVDTASLHEPARRPPRTGFILLKAQTELDFRPRALEQGLEIVDRQLLAMGQSYVAQSSQ